MKLTGLTPNLITADIDRSTAFYRDVLGFSVTTTVPDTAPLAQVQHKARVLMPLKDQWYGMTEFSVADPDGYVITFAERKA